MEMSKRGSCPQRWVSKGVDHRTPTKTPARFDEGFTMHTTRQCQQWEGMLCSEENLHMQIISHNWWMRQFVPVWHWNSVWTDVVMGPPMLMTTSFKRQGRLPTPTIRLIVSSHGDRKEGQRRFLKYNIKLVVIYQRPLASDSFVNSVVWQVANCHMCAYSAW